MKTLRFLALTWLACCLALPVAARPAQSAEQRLIGIWQDDKDPENIIQFYPDHRVRIYVPKRDGQATQVHWIDGRWWLTHGRTLTMKLNTPVHGNAADLRKFTVIFTRHGLTVKSGRRVLGRQHRINDTILRKHMW